MIKKKLNRNAKKVDKFINKFLKRQTKSLLVSPMKYGVLSGGKKIRSTIIFDTGKLFKIKNKKLINICAAVECIHSYSLIHDDLPCMDDDNFRRGKDSNHIKYGEANAILAGDALQTLAYEIICDDGDLKPNEMVEAIKLISMACGKKGMVYGQYLDVSSESKNLDEKTIESIHNLKTGELIKSSVMLGQIGNDDKTKKEALESFGMKIGLAFQITDDILEVTSDKETLGKNINSDSKNLKSTYVSVMGLDKSIDKSIKLSESAILDLDKVKSNDTNLLIELAKYITFREK